MEKVGEEEVDFESDPEEERRLLGMRRREAASDDEEGEGDAEDENKRRTERSGHIRSDDSESQAGAADDYDEEEIEEEDGVYEDGGEEEVKVGLDGGREVNAQKEALEGKKGEGRVDDEEEVVEEDGQEGKKENEPFAVPTAGAFYMHDDRFRDNAGSRNRRTYGGRKLWESRDDRKWGHDKFEELTSQDMHQAQGRRTSKGRYRARGGKYRGPDNEYARRNRSNEFGNVSDQSQAPKAVRGRGPRKYETALKNSSRVPPMQNRQSGKAVEKTFHGGSGRVFTAESKTALDQMPSVRKNSSLSSASPPFYPSGSSNNDITISQKRDMQAASTSKILSTSIVDEGFTAKQTNAMIRGKNIAESTGMDRLHIDDAINSAAGKHMNSMHILGASLANSMHSSQPRSQGRGIAFSGQMTHHPGPSHSQVIRASSTTQIQGLSRSSTQNRAQFYTEAPGQQSGNGSQASSPPKTASSVNSYEVGEVETAESNKTRTALVGKGKVSVQGSGRGSLLYGGTQVVSSSGNMGVGLRDQNFPTFLPVMQFGGQHPGGMGVPAVGMAFPGYVGQPQLGLGNSEMTWLPVLAGAAGALGATYCSPYLAVDGGHHDRPSGQMSSMGSSSKENNTNKIDDEWKPSNKSGHMGDELGQRQKPRRYSEMDFKQPSTST